VSALPKRKFFLKSLKASSRAIIVIILLGALTAVGSFAYFHFLTPKKLRIGFLQGDLHQLAFFVAVEKGFFADEGVEFDYFVYENGVKEMDAFKAGAIDIGYLGMAPATLKRIEARVNITIVAGVNAEGSAIVARSNILNITDLKGKNVAIPGFGTVQDTLLRIALNKHGLNYSKLAGGAPTATGPWNMPTLLRDGSIDAYIAWEPYCAKAVQDQSINAHILATSHDIWPEHPCCVIAVRTEFLERNHELVKKVVRVHVQATRWIANNFDEAVSIAKKWTGLSKEVINLAMENIVFLYQPSVAGVRLYLEYLIQFGYVDEKAIPEGIGAFAQQFVNTEIVQEVA
jgi:NitT/TauT family transport system substrate-binding protein